MTAPSWIRFVNFIVIRIFNFAHSYRSAG